MSRKLRVQLWVENSKNKTENRYFEIVVLTLLPISKNRKYHQNLGWSLGEPWLKYLCGIFSEFSFGK